MNNFVRMYPDMEDIIRKMISKSIESDFLQYTTKTKEEYIQYWKDNYRDKNNKKVKNIDFIPGDLLAANLIPFPDIDIDIIEDSERGGVQGRVISFTTNETGSTFETGKHKYFHTCKDSRQFEIYGAVILRSSNYLKNTGASIIIPITVDTDFHLQIVHEYAYGRYNKSVENIIKKILDQSIDACLDILSIWYAIQFAKLNPIIEEVVETHTKNNKERYEGIEEDIEVEDRKITKSKRVVRYVKKKYIREIIILENGTIKMAEDKAEKELKKEGKKYKRHKMIWLVPGHFRHYICNESKKSKNKIRVAKWINPYWAGPYAQYCRKHNIEIDIDVLSKRFIREREILLRNIHGKSTNVSDEEENDNMVRKAIEERIINKDKI